MKEGLPGIHRNQLNYLIQGGGGNPAWQRRRGPPYPLPPMQSLDPAANPLTPYPPVKNANLWSGGRPGKFRPVKE